MCRVVGSEGHAGALPLFPLLSERAPGTAAPRPGRRPKPSKSRCLMVQAPQRTQETNWTSTKPELNGAMMVKYKSTAQRRSGRLLDPQTPRETRTAPPTSARRGIPAAIRGGISLPGGAWRTWRGRRGDGRGCAGAPRVAVGGERLARGDSRRARSSPCSPHRAFQKVRLLALPGQISSPMCSENEAHG